MPPSEPIPHVLFYPAYGSDAATNLQPGEPTLQERAAGAARKLAANMGTKPIAYVPTKSLSSEPHLRGFSISTPKSSTPVPASPVRLYFALRPVDFARFVPRDLTSGYTVVFEWVPGELRGWAAMVEATNMLTREREPRLASQATIDDYDHLLVRGNNGWHTKSDKAYALRIIDRIIERGEYDPSEFIGYVLAEATTPFALVRDAEELVKARPGHDRDPRSWY